LLADQQVALARQQKQKSSKILLSCSLEKGQHENTFQASTGHYSTTIAKVAGNASGGTSVHTPKGTKTLSKHYQTLQNTISQGLMTSRGLQMNQCFQSKQAK